MEELITTPEEAQEAAELARALDGASFDQHAELPGVVGLLRSSQRSPELSDEAEERVLASLLAAPPKRSWRPTSRLVLAAGLALALIGGALLLKPRVGLGGSPLPRPQGELVAAQADAIRSGSMAPLEHQMSLYRETLYDGLEARYGVQP